MTEKKRGNPQNLKPNRKGQRNGGRQKGTPNKIPHDLKEKILFIVRDLEQKGKGLDVQAEANPPWFFEHFIKPMLPKNIDITGTAVKEIKVEFVGGEKPKTAKE